MRAVVLAVVATIAAGCGTREVVIVGNVDRAQGGRGDWPLAGGRIVIHDEQGEAWSRDITSASGRFRARAPAGQTIFATITGEGLTTTSFTGVSGLEDRMEVDPGLLYGIAARDVPLIRERFAGCPDAEGGGILFGEVRVIGITDPATGLEPTVTTAQVVAVRQEDGVEHTACYLDDAGEAYDPEATETGESGYFAIFGLQPGVHSMTIEYSAYVESDVSTFSEFLVPEAEDALVPRFPAWVEFPF